MKKILTVILFVSFFNSILIAEDATADSVTKLYIATFDRAPDSDGIAYWLDTGLVLNDIAQSFFDQSETKAKYPYDYSNQDFVIEIYKNLFKREPDDAGLTYWVAELDNKSIIRPLFILAIMNGATGDDGIILENKREVGRYFMYSLLNDLIQARNVMENVDATDASVIASKEMIDTYAKNSGTFSYVPKLTRQTVSYNYLGDVVTDNSLKDDGYYKSGIADNFERDDQKSVVSDMLTNLMWQDDINGTNVHKPYITKENFDAQKYTDTSGDTASTYCSELTLGEYTDWRLPTIDELMTLPIKGLPDRDSSNFPPIDKIFENIQGYDYWTNSEIADSNNDSSLIRDLNKKIWAVSFEYNHDKWIDKNASLIFTRCVRNIKPSVKPTFSKDVDSGIVRDNKTGLFWQDDYSDNNNEITILDWMGAINYCEELNLGGYTNWRLPNFNELFFIVDRTKYNPSIDSVNFNNTSSNNYWTSTTIDRKKNYAWSVNFYYGYGGNGDDWQLKSQLNYIRCVRSAI
jgi:hypothetical protein